MDNRCHDWNENDVRIPDKDMLADIWRIIIEDYEDQVSQQAIEPRKDTSQNGDPENGEE